jgi:hypothetical protein
VKVVKKRWTPELLLRPHVEELRERVLRLVAVALTSSPSDEMLRRAVHDPHTRHGY